MVLLADVDSAFVPARVADNPSLDSTYYIQRLGTHLTTMLKLQLAQRSNLSVVEIRYPPEWPALLRYARRHSLSHG